MHIKRNVATSENGFIFNPLTGDSFSGNFMASELLMMMKQGETAEVIKAHILYKYDVLPEQFDRDWDDWLLQLKEANLLD